VRIGTGGCPVGFSNIRCVLLHGKRKANQGITEISGICIAGKRAKGGGGEKMTIMYQAWSVKRGSFKVKKKGGRKEILGIAPGLLGSERGFSQRLQKENENRTPENQKTYQ